MKTYSTFINKYKPANISEFTDNNQFLNIIQTLIRYNNLNILFVGHMSSGKTTLLNTIIRAYYGDEVGDRIIENNVLFINNLKEQGIQYFRNEMKTFCQSRSSIHGKKKLVLIDDMDTINEQSQQVFRNYIDKYSTNIQFISVCTNLQKVIESLQSRLHIITIPRHSDAYIEQKLDFILAKENITINNEIKKYVLTNSNNSMRIMINFLEKIYVYGETININECKKLFSTISFQHFDDYYNCLKSQNLENAIKILYEIYDYGYSVIDILDFLFHHTKKTNLIDETEKYEVIVLLCKYITIFHNIHEDAIELALITNNIYKLITQGAF
jgi:DNA polymerase-3 subunit gamma/tau